jgi:hypothetical protein
MEIQHYIGIIISIVGGLFGAYLIVRVSIAELKKDINYLKDKIDAESSLKNKMEENHSSTINEVRDDVKAIFRTLTKMQVEQAKNLGQESIMKGIKEAIQDLKK